MSYPILFKANTTDFFSLGQGYLDDALSCVIKEELNGQFILEMDYPVNGKLYKDLKNQAIIQSDYGHVMKAQRFVIKKVTVSSSMVAHVYAEHISYITADIPLKRSLGVADAPANVALAQWTGALLYNPNITTDSNISTPITHRWEPHIYQNARTVLGGQDGSILDLYHGEYKFDNLHIQLLKKRGRTSNTMLAYGRNITSLEQEESILETPTGIYPFVKETHHDDKNNSTDTVHYLPELTLDGQYTKYYSHKRILMVDFSDKFSNSDDKDNKDNKPKYSDEELRKLAKEYLLNNEVGKPKVSMKVSAVDISKSYEMRSTRWTEELDLADEVDVYFELLGIKTKAKVVGVTWNVLNDVYDEFVIGEKRASLLQQFEQRIDQVVQQSGKQKEIITGLLSGDGTLDFYGNDPSHFPKANKIGDKYFVQSGTDSYIFQWNGKEWELLVSNRTGEIIEKKVNEEITTAKQEVKEDMDKLSSEIEATKKVAMAITLSDEELEKEIQDLAETNDKWLEEQSSPLRFKKAVAMSTYLDDHVAKLKEPKETEEEKDLKLQVLSLGSKIQSLDTIDYSPLKAKLTAEIAESNKAIEEAKKDEPNYGEKPIIAEIEKLKERTSQEKKLNDYLEKQKLKEIEQLKANLAELESRKFDSAELEKAERVFRQWAEWNPDISPLFLGHAKNTAIKKAIDEAISRDSSQAKTLEKLIAENKQELSKTEKIYPELDYNFQQQIDRATLEYADCAKKIVERELFGDESKKQKAREDLKKAEQSLSDVHSGYERTQREQQEKLKQKQQELEVARQERIKIMQQFVEQEKVKLKQKEKELAEENARIAKENQEKDQERTKTQAELEKVNQRLAELAKQHKQEQEEYNKAYEKIKADSYKIPEVLEIDKQLQALQEEYKKRSAEPLAKYKAEKDKVTAKFLDIDRNFASYTANAKGLESKITNSNQDLAKVKLDITGLESKIKNNKSEISEFKVKLNEFSSTMKNGTHVSSLKQQVDKITSFIGDYKLNHSTLVKQTEDTISQVIKTKGEDIISAINLNSYGATIKGNKIRLDGNVTVTNDFTAKVINGARINASQITSGTIDASKVHVINIDANNITGNKANLLSAVFENYKGILTINPSGIDIGNKKWGSQISIRPDGLHLIDDFDGEDVGKIHTNNRKGYDWYNGLSFDLNEKGDYMAWCSRDSDSEDTYKYKLVWQKKAFGEPHFCKGFNFQDTVYFHEEDIWFGNPWGHWSYFRIRGDERLHFGGDRAISMGNGNADFAFCNSGEMYIRTHGRNWVAISKVLKSCGFNSYQ